MKLIQNLKKVRTKRYIKKLIIKFLENPNANPDGLKEFMDDVSSVMQPFTDEHKNSRQYYVLHNGSFHPVLFDESFYPVAPPESNK
ncbi:hypothetical protein DSECCO2_197270 [anaerobic digester metagenome]